MRDLPGFGEKSEQNILKAAEQFKNLSGSGRVRINVADEEAQKLAAYIAQGRRSGRVGHAGRLAASRKRDHRRPGSTGDHAPGHDKQKDVDAVAAHILKYPGIDQELAHGENKVSFLLGSGLQVDVRLLEKKSFGAALLYFTGSKAHNVALRGRALRNGLDAERIRAHHAQRRQSCGRQD